MIFKTQRKELMNKILIIGNGFDLDLGLETSYSHFIKDDSFKSLVENNSLARAIEQEYQVKNWIDLETFLKNYIIAQSNSDSFANKDTSYMKQEFYAIQNSLNEYIGSKVIYNKIDKESTASRLLDALSRNGDYDIYNFNYTNFEGICNFCHVNIYLDCKYVHGQTKDDSIILGVEAHKDIPDDHAYLIKAFSHYYISRNIRQALKDAGDIIIFGHSLGETDYHYFSDFFEEQSSKELYKTEKNITIFTYDRESELSILKQLRRMNPNNDIGRLRDMNKFQIFCTGLAEDKKRIEDFLLHLSYSGEKISSADMASGAIILNREYLKS